MKRKVAIFLLTDKQGRVLLQHRTPDASLLPNYWAFFGGAIDEGETPEQAVRREAKEELQIEIENLHYFKDFHYKAKDVDIEFSIFTSSLMHSIEKLRNQQQEGQGLNVFSYEETLKLKMSTWDRLILQAFFNQ